MRALFAALTGCLLTATGTNAQVRPPLAGSAEALKKIQDHRDKLNADKPVKGQLNAGGLKVGASGTPTFIDAKVIQVLNEKEMLVGIEDARTGNGRYATVVMLKAPTAGITDGKHWRGAQWRDVTGHHDLKVTGTTTYKVVTGSTKTVFVVEGDPGTPPAAVAKGSKPGAAAYDNYPEPDRSKYVKDWEAERDALKRAIEDDKVRLSKATAPKDQKKYGDYIRTYTEKLARHELNDPPFFLGPPPKPVVGPSAEKQSVELPKPPVEVVKVRLESVRVVNSGANAVMVHVDWRNSGTRPVRSVRATIKAFDAKGKEVYSTEALIYESPKDFPGVAAGATYTEPKGKGHLVPNEPGKTPVKATVEVTKVEE